MAGFLVERLPQHSFERLYRRHVADVYRYASAVLSNPADAEDVTQTTFLNAFRAFERGERPREPLNWLIAIAHNVCRQRFRQAARRPNEVALDYDPADELVSEGGVQAEDIRHALSQLAFNQRAALVMRELEGRSYAEIAAALELSVGAVETLLFRARRALREQLETSLTCSEAERSISRQLDGALERRERGALRAHLRACPDCAALARRLRAQRTTLKSLAVLPLPASLASFSVSGGTVAGAGVAASTGGAALLKVALVAAAGIAASGAGYEVANHTVLARHHHPPAAVVAAPTATYAKTATHATTTVHGLARGGSAIAQSHRNVHAPLHAYGVTVAAQAAAAQRSHGQSSPAHAKGAARSANAGTSHRSSAGPAVTHPAQSRAQPRTHATHAETAKTTGTQGTHTSNGHTPTTPKASSLTPRQKAINACTLAEQTDPAAFALAYGTAGDKPGGAAFSLCVRDQLANGRAAPSNSHPSRGGSSRS